MSTFGKFKKGPVVKLPRPKKGDKDNDKKKEKDDKQGDVAVAAASTSASTQERKKPICSFSDSDDEDFKDPIAFKRDMKIKALMEQDSSLSRRRKKETVAVTLTGPKTKVSAATSAAGSATSTTKKRGRKKVADTSELPLFKRTDSEKGAAIEDRLGMVLDENSEKAKANEVLNHFYVRDAMDASGSLRMPERLEKYQSENKVMWNLSTGEVRSKDEAYVTRSVAEVKHIYDHRIPPKVKVKECDKRKELDISISSAEDSESVVKPSSNKLEKEKSVSSIVKGKPPLPSSSQTTRRQDRTPARKQKVVVENVSASMSTLSASSHQQSLTSTNPDAQNALLYQLSLDLLRAFVNKEDADLTVYGREEKRIRCHKIIIKARCPGLLREITQETSQKGAVREIISLTCFSHVAVKAFVKFLYSCKMNCLIGQDLNDFMDLASRYNVKVFQSFEVPPSAQEINAEKNQTPKVIEKREKKAPPKQLQLDPPSPTPPATVPLPTATDESCPATHKNEIPVIPSKSQICEPKPILKDSKDEHENEDNDSGANVSADLFEMSGTNSIERMSVVDEDHRPNGSLMDISTNNAPEEEGDWFEREFCSGDSKVFIESGVVAKDVPDSFDKDLFEQDEQASAGNAAVFENSAAVIMSESSKTIIEDNMEVVVDEEDPFADGGDSYFLNLPSVILPQSQTRTRSQSWCSTPLPQSTQRSVCRRPNGHIKAPASNISEEVGRENFSPSPPTAPKARKPKKTKPTKPNNRLSRAKSQDPSPSTNAGKSKSSPKYSLDYSTIDTPILRKELKRYGLKPLPRSKAKLILRHIEDETKKT